LAALEGAVVQLARERLAESQRRLMERRFRRSLDASAARLLVGNRRRRPLEDENPALIAKIGWRPSETPVPLERLIPADQRRLHRDVRAALETTGVAGPLTAEYVRADAVRVPVTLTAARVEPVHGECVAVLADRTADARALAGEIALLDAGDRPGPHAPASGATVIPRCSEGVESTGFLVLFNSGSVVGVHQNAAVVRIPGPDRGPVCAKRRRSA
jgi:hypothetical protein